MRSCTATLWFEYLCFVSELKCYSFLRANLTCCLSEQEITTTTRFERDTLALLNLRRQIVKAKHFLQDDHHSRRTISRIVIINHPNHNLDPVKTGTRHIFCFADC